MRYIKFHRIALIGLALAASVAQAVETFEQRFARIGVGSHRAEVIEQLGTADERNTTNTLGVERVELVYRREGNEFRVTFVASLVISKATRVAKASAFGAAIDRIFGN